MRYAELKQLLLSAAIFVNESTVAVAQTTICDPLGQNDNEVVRLAWTNEQGMPCSVAITEEGISHGVLLHNRFIGYDNEGEPLSLRFTTTTCDAKPNALSPIPALQVSLDGGVTYVAASEVRIVINHVDIPGEDGRGQLHVNVNPERLIYDVWTTRDEPLDHNIGTRCDPTDDLICGMVFEAA